MFVRHRDRDCGGAQMGVAGLGLGSFKDFQSAPGPLHSQLDGAGSQAQPGVSCDKGRVQRDTLKTTLSVQRDNASTND